MTIQIKAFFGPWRDVDVGQAQRFVRTMMDGMQAIPDEQKSGYIEARHLRGVSVVELMEVEQ